MQLIDGIINIECIDFFFVFIFSPGIIKEFKKSVYKFNSRFKKLFIRRVGQSWFNRLKHNEWRTIKHLHLTDYDFLGSFCKIVLLARLIQICEIKAFIVSWSKSNQNQMEKLKEKQKRKPKSKAKENQKPARECNTIFFCTYIGAHVFFINYPFQLNEPFFWVPESHFKELRLIFLFVHTFFFFLLDL